MPIAGDERMNQSIVEGTVPMGMLKGKMPHRKVIDKTAWKLVISAQLVRANLDDHLICLC